MKPNEHLIEEIKSRVDLSRIINLYTLLNRRNFAICPFHEEKTPSFSVSIDKGLWYCFGCHEGGDLFSFLMKVENLTFPEALNFLSSYAGIENRPIYSSQKVKEIARETDVLIGLEESFKDFERIIADYLLCEMQSLNWDKPLWMWYASAFKKELVINEKFNQFEILRQKRKDIFINIRRGVRR